MNKAHLSTLGNNNTWITPKYITDALGQFDLDPCAHTKMPFHHAKKEYTYHDNGLAQKWEGRVWLNPPFDRRTIGLWMRKMMLHKNGIMLIPSAMETKRFQKFVFGSATGILILDHRPKFLTEEGVEGGFNSGQTICLISYDKQNLKSLINSRLGVVLNECRQVTEQKP